MEGEAPGWRARAEGVLHSDWSGRERPLAEGGATLPLLIMCCPCCSSAAAATSSSDEDGVIMGSFQLIYCDSRSPKNDLLVSWLCLARYSCWMCLALNHFRVEYLIMSLTSLFHPAYTAVPPGPS